MARIKPQALLQQSKKKKAPSRISAVTIAIYSLVVIVLGFFLFTSYKHWTSRSSNPSEELSSVEHTTSIGDSRKSEIPKYAVIKTSKGSITVELFKESSPEDVNEFIKSCKKGRFEGMPFSRVIKNFVIQGGDATRIGNAEDWTSRGKQYNQLDASLKHEAFMVGTSKKTQNDDGKGFDIVITTAPIPDLNEKINVFGRVVKGEDVVQEIEEVDTDQHYRPKTPIKITQVTLTHKP
ncbi:peptidyl-prolyl cis-trans isomerase CYP21-4-like [Andrographis paniculata]|uniref:peptidyl-prolyl cis-trans isomerase CYP21-4-like n=1 Tax=Andrographis paniculata TaxID=175694 RepID=UPI0021E88B25|nr:peptidyl-prolyl cis-trans isomerase CYP21-4-like [Andrographis paniculata]XP_051118776.1 peptidyl-prolyl cis-trans isomerase CYP21-4-like [Andrographis paniculata]XP_051118777.1 peptidyl-prolyl cis-trans isomerase CYP21-4-like [Andrographis paniculata]XP_051118779.1 peptidyl-prolyl cis-trans isomerase CYP21-4-like [Andrographis paniculata]XP_051118780.1 peptidyl-prolyl cis-trans isomerase CYP21-4-like [Andrographis paniculata]XP_051118781.1 peptidyl-prolyl cis-trans isomerase CYP21-4-like [